MTNKKNKEFFLFSNKFIAVVMLLVSSVSIYTLVRLNMIPDKYLYPLVGLAVIVNLVMLLGLFKSKKKGLFKVLSLLVSLGLIVGSFYFINGTASFLDTITDADKNVHNVAIVVRKDSEYKKVDDVKDLKFAANTMVEDKAIEKALPLIQSKFKFTPEIIDYKQYDSLGNDLLNNTVEVILVSEANLSTINELVDGFNSETRILGMVSYEEKIETVVPEVNVKKDTYSIFVTGIDTYGSIASVSRSDVNMIVTVSPSTGQILLTSIPRDYHVELGTKGKLDKLTHAGIYGVDESVKTLEKLLDIEIEYFLKVNFSSVENIVNALGGVDVYSHYTFVSASGVSFTKGMNYVDGNKALTFVRERYNLPNGDNDRVVHQQELIKGILNKAMSPKIITNFNGILNSVSGAMQTSIPSNKLTGIVKDQLDTNRSWEIIQYSLTGEGSMSNTTYSMYGHNVYVMNPDQSTVEKAHKLIQSMENGERITIN